MADIVFRYPEMQTAANEIKELAGQYRSAASSFETAFLESTSGWKGDSRDKMAAFISGPVKEYMEQTVPKLLESLAELLDANAKQMKSADEQIAQNIPTSLG